MSADRYPLANDLHGDPLDVPESAVAWRVRRASGKPGRPANVFDPETGKQLEVPLVATVDDLRDAGCAPGRYRLEAVDGNGKAIVGVVAFTEIAESNDQDDDSDGAGDKRKKKGKASAAAMMELVRQSMDVQCRMIEAMASAFGPMRPAQPVPIIVEQPAAVAAPSGIGGMKPEQIMEMLFSGIKTLSDVWRSGTNMASGGATDAVKTSAGTGETP